MNIHNLPKITDDIRNKLGDIFNSQFKEIENDVNSLFNFVFEDKGHFINYINIYASDKNNVVYMQNGPLLMSAFNFSVKNTLRVYRLLGLETMAPKINAMRVFPNTTIPLHVDPNNGSLGRELLLYTIVTSGSDGIAYAANNITDSPAFISKGKTEFLISPTRIAHGAQSGIENYDILQIQLKAEI